METDFKKLNRFTTIPFLIDMLVRKKLTLLSPALWEDYNDRETMEVYRKSIGARSIYALCFTHGGETIHHWNTFSAGAGGCYIEFSPQKLFQILQNHPGVQHGKVQYVSMRDIASVTSENFAFIKRQPYLPEKEYRIIVAAAEEQQPVFEFDLDISVIRRITINNKMPAEVFRSLKKSLLCIAPDYKGSIYQSTLLSNPVWINHFRGRL
ncbi:hypothetical protein CHU92_08525 [Flavobacterium cyanobacteriorum]|uniref:DUF2971 domain-containing protein n=1 Tax=Flavobacterium cyanobacteriorum TaxID=2022802 RepID=A0A255Z6Q4_9FLAO|nr:hypothetical protein [Flavobacterium cyanobacteriorum]OYQ37227.1 hypothetical protein CHU92_08525 [Flavobacterium cyanobacteriorum]